MKSLPARISAVVFDCDGLLLDTETCWTRAETAIFAAHGFGFGPEQKQLLIGRSIAAACIDMAEYFGRPGENLALESELLARVEAELRADVVPLPGAFELVRQLAGRVPIAVATNSPRQLLDEALAKSQLGGYFEVTIAADEVARPKPDPQLYLEAFARLGADPRRGVALEDSGTGVAAARASGAFVIAVPSLIGTVLNGDLVTSTLADPVIVEWAATVTT